MADTALADKSSRALQTNGLLVIAPCQRGIDGVRGAMAGRAVDSTAAVRFAIAIECGFISRQVGVGVVNMHGGRLAQVLPMAAFARGHVDPGDAGWAAHVHHAAMTAGASDVLFCHRVAQALCLRTGVAGLAGVRREVVPDQFVGVERVYCG